MHMPGAPWGRGRHQPRPVESPALSALSRGQQPFSPCYLALNQAPDEAKIQAGLVRLQQLQARALDPALTPEAIEAPVRPFEREMSGEELTELAKRFGIHKKQTSKARTVAAI